MGNGSSNVSSAHNGTPDAGFEIYHADVPAKKFTIISNDMARGKFPVQLRALERIILFHFLSLDSGMRMTRRHVDIAVAEGRNAVTVALGGLERKGYLRRSKVRLTSGLWRWRWQVTDDPVQHPLPDPETGLPQTESRSMDATSENTASSQVAPQTGNPALENGSIIEDRSTKTGNEDCGAKKQPPVDTRASARVSTSAETRDDHHEEDHEQPIRLAHLDVNGKIRTLTGEWIKRLQQQGLEPGREIRGEAGRGIRRLIEKGRTNRELIDAVRNDADRIVREETNKTDEQRRAEERKRRANAEFAEFFTAYPRQSAEDMAVQAWNEARRKGATAQQLIEAARRYAAQTPRGNRNSCPYPHTWLRQGQWRWYADRPAA